MKKFFIFLMFITILSVYIITTPGIIQQSPHSPNINISGKWKIFFEDNPEIAGYGYDDAAGTDIILPGNWIEAIRHKESMASVIWLRKSVYIDNSFSDSEMVLDLGNIAVANEVYFNGCFIGVTGGMPKGNDILNYLYSWKTPRYYLIPKFLIRFNQQNNISIRVFSHVINGVKGNLQITTLWDEFPYRLQDTIQGLVNNFAIMITVFFIFFFAVQYFYDRSNRIFLYITLIAISSIVLYTFIVEIPFYMNGLMRFKIVFIAYCSISFFLALLIQQFVKRKNSSIIAFLLTGLYFSSILGTLITPSTRTLVVYTRIYVLICTYIFQFYTFAGVIALIKRYWLFILVIPVCLSTIHNDYYIWIMNYDSIYNRVFVHVPILLLIFIFFMFFDFRSQIDDKETIFQTMRKKAHRLQHELNKIKNTNVKRQPSEVIYDLINHIDANFVDTYERTKLAKMFGLNENYMVQIFKKTTGKTLSDYINMKRIEKGIEMLSDCEIRIIDIAYNIGFENYNHFFNCFKKNTGMSPGEYRKMLSGSG